ncbi:hypothetical protein HHX48_12760 [Salinimonas sp. HHU 13199]|uniref:PEP-CTERM protein-sorting domain-containing protein n=1 Tax=Salinimonas profundi TaxID=2729140 RepID=A0ABR8LNJ6_9ALTE|nr:hypothetical protein [Salinimonas profundi]MBD3586611.1 hypothetical protein [Salinimonas profundi]
MLVGAAWTSQAAMCGVSDVQITEIQVLDGSAAEQLATPLNATECVGSFTGNNSSFTKPVDNLGYKDDGWFNVDSYNGWWDTPGVFVEDDALQNLQGKGEIDPGWIYVGKAEADSGFSFNGATMDNGDTSYTFLDSLLTISCPTQEDGICDDASSGTFSWTPPATNPDALMELLGGEFFDKVGIVFKAATQFVIYEFDLKELGLNPVYDGDPNYAFKGTWDVSQTLVKTNKNDKTVSQGLSNVTVWARDPAAIVDVPAPTTLVLVLFGLALVIRRRFMQ